MQASCLQSGYSQLFGLCIALVARTNCGFFHKCRCWSLLHFKHSHVRTTLLCTEYKRREKNPPVHCNETSCWKKHQPCWNTGVTSYVLNPAGNNHFWACEAIQSQQKHMAACIWVYSLVKNGVRGQLSYSGHGLGIDISWKAHKVHFHLIF